MEEKNIEPDNYAYAVLMRMHVDAGEIKQFRALLEASKEKGFVPYEDALKLLLKIGDTKSFDQLLMEMRENEGLLPREALDLIP